MIHLVAKVFVAVLTRLWPFFGIANVARAQNTFFTMPLIVVLVFWSSLLDLTLLTVTVKAAPLPTQV